MRYLILIALFLFVQPATAKLRIVSLSGATSEILVALGLEESIVGVDATSVYPSCLKSKTNVGYRHKISIEGILSLRPNLIVGLKNSLSDTQIKHFTISNVRACLFDQEYSVQGTKNLIMAVAKVTNRQAKAKKIISDFDRKLSNLQLKSNFNAVYKPKVLFIYARGVGSMMVAGKNTPLDVMIHLAGGQNAISGFYDYKPLTPEALIKANPDVILMFDSGFISVGGIKGLLKVPGIQSTSAGKNHNFVHMNGHFLSAFGPSLPNALLELNQKISN